jgi:hypothetical protein
MEIMIMQYLKIGEKENLELNINYIEENTCVFTFDKYSYETIKNYFADKVLDKFSIIDENKTISYTVEMKLKNIILENQTDKNFDVITVCFEKLQVDDRVAVLEKTVQELTSMLENLQQKVVMR